MKHLAILGSTGSIGTNALKVVKQFPSEFKVIALSANSNIDLLSQQIKEFRPSLVSVQEEGALLKLKAKLGKGTKALAGNAGLKAIVQDERIDTVLLAISGSSALLPLVDALEAGKDVALANKEALVMAGSLIMQKAKAHKSKIMPIDSEQSAIWQCLKAEEKKQVNKIYLTASGGPLRKLAKSEFKHVLVERVIAHPRWKMGKKISVDSASLMNKGLEVIEAMYLFDLAPERIEVLIHPEAIIHSMVEFIDGVIIAQLSATDMRIPIQYALSFPRRLKNASGRVNFLELKSLNFEAPDFAKFPCLKLAFEAAKGQGTLPCVLNAANEVCVDEFLKEKLAFVNIPKIIGRVMVLHKKINHPSLNEILDADLWARQAAYQLIGRKN